jgi:hypothetical protein
VQLNKAQSTSDVETIADENDLGISVFSKQTAMASG